MNKLAFVLLAGGQGNRMMNDTPKQFLRVAGKTILEHSLDSLSLCAPQARMIVVVPVDALELSSRLLANKKNVEIVVGGSSRQASTLKALLHLSSNPPQKVVIHDAARPFISCQVVHDVISALDQHEAVDVAIPTADTIIVERDGFIQSIPSRTHILRGQTPQGFHYPALLQAYRELGEDRLQEFTDDCGIYLACNPLGKVRIVKGSTENIKITDAVDLVLADELFRMRAGQWSPEKQGLDVRGKRAIIFGGSKGIGHAMAQILSGAECKVAIASRASGCDITDYQQVSDSMARFESELGEVDYVVNCVGMLAKHQLHLQPRAEVEEMIAVNFLGAVNVAKASHDVLRHRKGMLLQFASSSYTRGRAEYTPYSASKAAIVNLTQGLAEEWQDDQIRVNCLVPGRTDTAMRKENFGTEAPCSLLSPFEVALTGCKLLSSDQTGMVVRV